LPGAGVDGDEDPEPALGFLEVEEVAVLLFDGLIVLVLDLREFGPHAFGDALIVADPGGVCAVFFGEALDFSPQLFHGCGTFSASVAAPGAGGFLECYAVVVEVFGATVFAGPGHSGHLCAGVATVAPVPFGGVEDEFAGLCVEPDGSIRGTDGVIAVGVGCTLDHIADRGGADVEPPAAGGAGEMPEGATGAADVLSEGRVAQRAIRADEGEVAAGCGGEVEIYQSRPDGDGGSASHYTAPCVVTGAVFNSAKVRLRGGGTWWASRRM